MGKGHRDNHAARKKRGPAAFETKRKRRSGHGFKCSVCGGKCRPAKLVGGVCSLCRRP